MKVDVLVGLQWGSEAKGRVAQNLADRYNTFVRCGGSNAGHTIYIDGRKLVTRHLPCGVANIDANLIIGPGAAVDPAVLAAEIQAANLCGLDVERRLFIDPRAVIITPHHIADEQSTLGAMGSTCHGVGAAFAGKITDRNSAHVLVRDYLERGYLKIGGTAIRSERIEALWGTANLIEGTQGAWLSLDLGDWPYVTSKNPTAGALAAECGIGPRHIQNVIGVLRSYPIRVGGPSGPMHGGEIDWATVAEESGYGDKLQPEITTVTQRIRRVARLHMGMLQTAIMWNGCTHLVVTHCDYWDHEAADFRGNLQQLMDSYPKIGGEIASIAAQTGVGILGATWGPAPDQATIEWNGVLSTCPV